MSGPSTSVDGRIAKTSPANGNGTALAPQRRGIASTIESLDFKRALAQALPKHMTADKMARVALTALRVNPLLAQSTPESFFACLMQCAQLGLEPNSPTQEAYLIPRKNNRNGTVETTLIVGYQGLIALALRSGKVEKIWTRVVHEGDHFRVKYGLVEDIEHEPSTEPGRDQRPITYVYAVAKLTTGGTVFEVMSREQVETRRRENASPNSSPWQKHYESMVRKTAVRALSKWIPKSSEMALAEAIDERGDEGKPQLVSDTAFSVMEGMGINPIYEADGESVPHDKETGEVMAQVEPGANG